MLRHGGINSIQLDLFFANEVEFSFRDTDGNRVKLSFTRGEVAELLKLARDLLDAPIDLTGMPLKEGTTAEQIDEIMSAYAQQAKQRESNRG